MYHRLITLTISSFSKSVFPCDAFYEYQNIWHWYHTLLQQHFRNFLRISVCDSCDIVIVNTLLITITTRHAGEVVSINTLLFTITTRHAGEVVSINTLLFTITTRHAGEVVNIYSSQLRKIVGSTFVMLDLPRLWYGSLSGSISLNHLSIFYNISCYNSLVGMKGTHFWDEDKRRSFLKLTRYCKISSRSEDSLFVFWRLFHTFMYIYKYYGSWT
jgi:hypothetical protein